MKRGSCSRMQEPSFFVMGKHGAGSARQASDGCGGLSRYAATSWGRRTLHSADASPCGSGRRHTASGTASAAVRCGRPVGAGEEPAAYPDMATCAGPASVPRHFPKRNANGYYRWRCVCGAGLCWNPGHMGILGLRIGPMRQCLRPGRPALAPRCPFTPPCGG